MRTALLLAGALVLTGCTGGGRTTVAAPAYPLAWLAEQVGGDDVRVVGPDGDAHDAALTPAQRDDADVVLSLPGLATPPGGEHALDLAGVVSQQPAASDLGDEEDPGPDPHVWLDPDRMAAAAEALGDRLGTDGARARARTTAARLRALGASFRTGLQGCARQTVVTGHLSLAYLAGRDDLQQTGVTGDARQDPVPGRVQAVEAFAQEGGVTTLLVDPGPVPAAVAQVARDLRLPTAVLDPLDARPAQGDYRSAMAADLQVLRAALDCP